MRFSIEPKISGTGGNKKPKIGKGMPDRLDVLGLYPSMDQIFQVSL